MRYVSANGICFSSGHRKQIEWEGGNTQVFALRAVLRRHQGSATDRENGSTSGGPFLTTVASFSSVGKTLARIRFSSLALGRENAVRKAV